MAEHTTWWGKGDENELKKIIIIINLACFNLSQVRGKDLFITKTQRSVYDHLDVEDWES